MPGTSGQKFYGQARSIDPDSAARIVFITGAASLPDISVFLASVPNACLEKPFNRRELERVVHELGPAARGRP